MPTAGQRARAIKRGDSTYFTGKPCKHGHVSDRATITGACIACQREALKREKEAYAAARERRYGR